MEVWNLTFLLTFCTSEVILIYISTAGKSTLLQLLAGKRLISMAGAELKVKGCDVFRDSPSGVTFLGTEWSLAK
jgi:CCR4-NOT complex subunit CAF16